MPNCFSTKRGYRVGYSLRMSHLSERLFPPSSHPSLELVASVRDPRQAPAIFLTPAMTSLKAAFRKEAVVTHNEKETQEQSICQCQLHKRHGTHFIRSPIETASMFATHTHTTNVQELKHPLRSGAQCVTRDIANDERKWTWKSYEKTEPATTRRDSPEILLPTYKAIRGEGPNDIRKQDGRDTARHGPPLLNRNSARNWIAYHNYSN